MRAFRFRQDRRVFLALHALLRNALSHSYPLAPEEWRFSTNAYGKPQIPSEFGLRFNLSRSPKLVICLVSRGIEVGVDLEPQERAGKIVEIAPRVLSPSELIQFELLTAQEKLNRALSLWTLKEAFTKACGMGLSLPLTRLSFLFEGDEARLEVDPDLGINSGRWQFSLFEHLGHRIAVVTERMADAFLQLCEVRPVLAEPRSLVSAITRWF
jgi:4'-phosphopantetheinyl transferase